MKIKIWVDPVAVLFHINVSRKVCFALVAVSFYFIVIVFLGMNINLSFFSSICQPNNKKKSGAFFIVIEWYEEEIK